MRAKEKTSRVIFRKDRRQHTSQPNTSDTVMTFSDLLSACTRLPVLSIVLLTALATGRIDAQTGADRAALDTIRAGRFDGGKMWTFEYSPGEYFTETYGFDANPAWFERARLSAVRIPGCSASFVSPNGLLATNHHCVRGAIVRVTRPDEAVVTDTFMPGASLDSEARLPLRVTRVSLATRNDLTFSFERNCITTLLSVTDLIVPPKTPAGALDTTSSSPIEDKTPTRAANLCILNLTKSVLIHLAAPVVTATNSARSPQESMMTYG